MLLYGTMCESMVLAQSGSVMSVTCGIINILIDAQDLGYILWQCWCLGAILSLGPECNLGQGCCPGP